MKEDTVDIKEEERLIEERYQEVVDIYTNRREHPEPAKLDLIDKSFKFAYEAHKDVRRKSGEPYIFHPIEVAKIVSGEIGLGSTSIAAAFLHDVVEDTEYTLEDIATLFGETIATIVDGLTKLSGKMFEKGNVSLQSENFRKLLLTMSDDIRVIMIKIADRLHNMRTLEHMIPKKQYKIAAETLYLYAPLAYRLGLFPIKVELENLAFKFEHPDLHGELSKKIMDRSEMLGDFYQRIRNIITPRLESQELKVELRCRIKTPYSVWKKMQDQDVKIEEINDLMAIRIIFEPDEGKSIEEEHAICWHILSILNSIYRPKYGRLRDWLSTPKSNGYEALHSTLIPEGVPVEVQIKSKRMDDIAERGCAAHWKYKEHLDNAGAHSELDGWLSSIQELLEEHKGGGDENDFFEDLKLTLFDDEIFVFTPRGDIHKLPRGASVLDLAFVIHSDLGFRCIGAKRNQKLVPVNEVLKSGDQVEILTAKSQSIQDEWINYVVTSRAKSQIRRYLQITRKDSIQRGEKMLREELDRLNIPYSPKVLNQLKDLFLIRKTSDLNHYIATHEKSLDRVISFLSAEGEKGLNKFQVFDKPAEGDKEKGITYYTSPCCNPIPGDDTIGYERSENEVMIHRRDCDDAIRLMASKGDRILNVEWDAKKVNTYLITVNMRGIDSQGLVNRITQLLSNDLSINMRSILFESQGGIFQGKLELYVPDVNYAITVLEKLSKIEGVNSVIRK